MNSLDKIIRFFTKSRFFLNRSSALSDKRLPKGFFFNAVDIKTDDEFTKIIPIGSFPEHPYGAHEITLADVQSMYNNFQSRGTDLLVDYEHGSLWGETKAAGWSPEVQVRDDGLYMKYPEFTPVAKNAVDAREYRYFSPVYNLQAKDKQGNRVGAVIDSVAITNRPYMVREIQHIRNQKTVQEDEMKYSEELKKKLGLAATATDDEVEKKLDDAVKAMNDHANDSSVEKDDEKDDADKNVKPEESAVLNSVISRLDAIQKRLDDGDNKSKDEKVEALVNSAVSSWKITAAEKDVYMNAARNDYEGTKKIVDARKVNAVRPGRMPIDEDRKAGGDVGVNRLQSCADYIRSQRAVA